VGFIVERRWVCDFYVDQGVEIPWQIAPLPKGPTGRKSTTSSWALGISANTKHPEAAWALANWLMSKEGILTIGIYGVPQRKSVVQSKVFLENNVSPEENQIFVDEMPEAVFMPPTTPKWAQLNNEAFNPQLDRLWANEATAKEVAAEMVAKANEILQSD
jgi:ABC-type glycerol-3-phosphate transport system substrate-binding protein